MSTYYYKKKTIRKQDVDRLFLHFDNGDYVTVAAGEIYDLSLSYYDRLIVGGKGLIPVASDGYLKLHLSSKSRIVQMPHEVENDEAYRKDREGYLTERLMREGDVREIWFFNELNWHYAVACRIEATQEKECLLLRFLPQPWMGGCDAERHRIALPAPEKSAIDRVYIDFENCEGFVVYAGEIVECRLQFAPTLEWNACELCRKIVGGYLILDLEYRKREGDVFYCASGRPKRKDYLRRLCGEKGGSETDISHLYVTYHGPYYYTPREECMETEQVGFTEEEIDREFAMRSHDEEQYDEEADDLSYVCGYAKQRRDGRVIVAFGENAEETVKNSL